jgi:hypothetical protein
MTTPKEHTRLYPVNPHGRPTRLCASRSREWFIYGILSREKGLKFFQSMPYGAFGDVVADGYRGRRGRRWSVQDVDAVLAFGDEKIVYQSAVLRQRLRPNAGGHQVTLFYLREEPLQSPHERPFAQRAEDFAGTRTPVPPASLQNAG